MREKNTKLLEFIRQIYRSAGAISLHEPNIGEHESELVRCAIESNCVASVGEFIPLLEEKLSASTQRQYAIATVNGTAALHLALLSLNVGEGDEVITQPLNFVAGCNSIRYCGAHPVFVDVNKKTLGMDAESLNEFLSTCTEYRDDGKVWNKKTNRMIRACMPMNTFGHGADLKNLTAVLAPHGIKLISDAAEAVGSHCSGVPVAKWGEVAILSFNGNKIVTTGGGGAVLVDCKEQAERIRFLATTAKRNRGYEVEHTEIGFNYRMPNLNAAVGCAQMERLNEFVKIKREIARRYKEECSRLGIEFFSEPESGASNYWLNCIIARDRVHRDEFIRAAIADEIKVRPVWQLMHQTRMHRDAMRLELPNAEWLADRIVNLPSGVKGSVYEKN